MVNTYQKLKIADFDLAKIESVNMTRLDQIPVFTKAQGIAQKKLADKTGTLK